MQTNGIAALDTCSEAYGQPAVSISEAATGPSWQKARGGSGRGRLSGLAQTFFLVFLFHRSQWLRRPGPCPAMTKGSQSPLFRGKNSDCKIHFGKKNPCRLYAKRTVHEGTRQQTQCIRRLSRIHLSPRPSGDSELTIWPGRWQGIPRCWRLGGGAGCHSATENQEEPADVPGDGAHGQGP